ncbi:MAG: hypothetical protein NZ748_01030 [Candidatus Marinimicrobia bacterium]|nr:hypothetical protein [Candidatus Neomarinimicrobiota bacterium]
MAEDNEQKSPTGQSGIDDVLNVGDMPWKYWFVSSECEVWHDQLPPLKGLLDGPNLAKLLPLITKK